MKSNELIEDYRSDDIEPTEDAGCYDFDWETLFADLGENEASVEPEDYQRMGQALGVIFDWLLAVDLNKKSAARLVGKRVLALAWVMDPRRFAGEKNGRG